MARMTVARMGWVLAYYASTAASLATVAAVAMQIYVENLDALDRSDAYAWLGAAAGALLGLWFASKKRNSPTTHRVLRIVGVSFVVLGLVGGFVMFKMARGQHDTSGVMFAGLAEFIMGLLAFGVAAIGIALWLAGFSGRRIATPLTAES